MGRGAGGHRRACAIYEHRAASRRAYLPIVPGSRRNQPPAADVSGGAAPRVFARPTGLLLHVKEQPRGATARDGIVRGFDKRGLDAGLAWIEQVKLLETLVRATSVVDLGAAAVELARRWEDARLWRSRVPALLRDLFNNVALSPYTDFVPKTLALVAALERSGRLTAEEHVDFLSFLLRQLGRHLTAYDLVTFHHQGANYPDILLLDMVLRAFLQQVEERPWLFEGSAADDSGGDRQKRLRRRSAAAGVDVAQAVRGASCSRCSDFARRKRPYSARALRARAGRTGRQPLEASKDAFRWRPPAPASDGRRRTSTCASIADLATPNELRELGVALFLDRPLGAFKAPGEPDQTPILAYEAFSRSIAGRRLDSIAEDRELLSVAEQVR